MNNVSGLKRKVFGQGYHFKIPLIEVKLNNNKDSYYI
jgi:hypothetical protein